MPTPKTILAAVLATGAFIPLTPARAQNPAASVNIDATANRHAINPLIYGVAFASRAALSDLNAPLNRSGGNATTRYNWQLNASNRAADWFFESIGEDSDVPGELGDTFIADSKAAGAQAMLTLPTIGWAAKLGANRAKLSSFSVAKYGAQQWTDYWMPDAGNGVRTNGQTITGNDPSDANVAVDVAFQGQWVDHLVSRWGQASGGGLKYYTMDNEPSIWFATHRDVRPVGATMEQIKNDIITYGSRVKQSDPSALVVGPEEWGWSGYLYSGYDQQYGAAHGWSSYPDRAAHGGMDYLPWLLDQLHQHDATAGKRLLDVFSVHFYPQGGEFGNDTGNAMQLRRNRSTRALWDPNYTDETWISDKVQLIPRLKNWADTYYPGTQIGLTEYNWGAESHINGATAQADILGIFGREGLDLANRWTTPDAATPAYKAMKLYRNYDGHKSTFGDTSVSCTGPNPDNVAAFAALRATDGALTVMVVNKYLSGATPVTLNLAHFAAGAAAQAWQLTSANAITRLADVPVGGNHLSASVPAQSITLFVIPAAGSGELPSISVDNVRLNEGPAQGAPAGTTYFTFHLTLSAPSAQAVSVTFQTANGTAVTPGDYTARPATTVTFAPGTTSKPVTVAVKGDATPEANETFTLNLSNPVNATLADGQGVGTIDNDDTTPPLPTLSVDDVAKNEGDSGMAYFTFHLTLSAPSAKAVSVTFQTANGTAGAPGDYTAKAPTTITFVPGATAKTVSIAVKGDTAFEANETFTLNLSNPVNATIADGTGTGTIRNDDVSE